MTLDVYRGRKTTNQQQQQHLKNFWTSVCVPFIYLFLRRNTYSRNSMARTPMARLLRLF